MQAQLKFDAVVDGRPAWCQVGVPLDIALREQYDSAIREQLECVARKEFSRLAGHDVGDIPIRIRNIKVV